MMARSEPAREAGKGESNVGVRAAREENDVVPDGAVAMGKKSRRIQSGPAGQGISLI